MYYCITDFIETTHLITNALNLGQQRRHDDTVTINIGDVVVLAAVGTHAARTNLLGEDVTAELQVEHKVKVGELRQGLGLANGAWEAV